MVDSDFINIDRTRTVYDDDKILELQERVAALDGFDNVSVFFNDTGKILPYEHQYAFAGGKDAKP